MSCLRNRRCCATTDRAPYVTYPVGHPIALPTSLYLCRPVGVGTPSVARTVSRVFRAHPSSAIRPVVGSEISIDKRSWGATGGSSPVVLSTRRVATPTNLTPTVLTEYRPSEGGRS